MSLTHYLLFDVFGALEEPWPAAPGPINRYKRDHWTNVKNDEFDDLPQAARSLIINAAAFFEGQVNTDDTPQPSAAERLALKRAMARFVTDSGIASARGWR